MSVKSQPVVVGLNAPLIEDHIIHACNPEIHSGPSSISRISAVRVSTL